MKDNTLSGAVNLALSTGLYDILEDLLKFLNIALLIELLSVSMFVFVKLKFKLDLTGLISIVMQVISAMIRVAVTFAIGSEQIKDFNTI
jgi:hypothetical protein